MRPLCTHCAFPLSLNKSILKVTLSQIFQCLTGFIERSTIFLWHEHYKNKVYDAFNDLGVINREALFYRFGQSKKVWPMTTPEINLFMDEGSAYILTSNDKNEGCGKEDNTKVSPMLFIITVVLLLIKASQSGILRCHIDGGRGDQCLRCDYVCQRNSWWSSSNWDHIAYLWLCHLGCILRPCLDGAPPSIACRANASCPTKRPKSDV